MNNQSFSGNTATQTTGTTSLPLISIMITEQYSKESEGKERAITLAELHKDLEESKKQKKAPLIEPLPELLTDVTPVEVLYAEPPEDTLNELVKWDEIEHQIDIERDINVLGKYHAVLANKEFRKQLDGSIRGINKCEKYKIKVEMAFGDYYKNLENNSGRPEKFVNRLDKLSPKQLAEEEIGKSRETISKYTEISNIKNREENLKKYESECNAEGLEMSSTGFYKFATNNKINLKEINTGDNEWYTPKKDIDKIKLVLGTIDLDPASCDFAQKTVNAAVYYTNETNGLDKKWIGNVFMNPPFSKEPKKGIKAFTDKFIAEYKSGNIKQGIVLTNNSTETRWFQNLMKISTVACLAKERVKFYNEEKVGHIQNGQVFFYAGENEGKFIEVFANVGLIIKNA